MIKIFKKPYFFLTLIVILTFFIYLPTITNFPEGDDFLFLWHIRVPVSFMQIPFDHWDQPMAGRYGYGQAWYGAALYRIFGFEPYVFNFFGIILKIIALISVYIFARRLTKNETIALISALVFALISNGINGAISFCLQFALLFLANFLISSSLFLEGLKEKKIGKTILASLLLLIGNYLYTIRAIGIVLLPLWVILRFKELNSTKLKLISLIISISIVLLSVLMVANFIPDAKNFTTQTLIAGSQGVLKSVQQGNYEYIRSLLVSISFMPLPQNFYSVINQLFDAGNATQHYLKIGASFTWTLLFIMFIFPLYLLKSINKYQLGISFFSGIVWNLILLYFVKAGVTLFYPSEVVVVTLGVDIFLIGIILGLIYLKIKPRIGATLLSSISAALLFYIPNWLHAPDSISITEHRYHTVSSGFVAIFLAILIYLIFKQTLSLFQKKRIGLGNFYIFFAVIFTATVLIFHFKTLNQIISEHHMIRRADIILSHWNFVKSKVDFNRKPLIVVVWISEDIFKVKREFFKDETLALIGNLPWDYKLTEKVKLFNSHEESQKAICDFKRNGISFDYNNYYEFRLTADRNIIDWSDKGREQLKTWKDYCQDKVKGIETGDSI